MMGFRVPLEAKNFLKLSVWSKFVSKTERPTIEYNAFIHIHKSPPSQPPNCSIWDHAEETKLVYNDFCALSRCNKFDTKITEGMLIHQMRPALNKHEASDPLKILS